MLEPAGSSTVPLPSRGSSLFLLAEIDPVVAPDLLQDIFFPVLVLWSSSQFFARPNSFSARGYAVDVSNAVLTR